MMIKTILIMSVLLALTGCEKKEKLLPVSEQCKVTGKGHAIGSNYSATVYNGSSWAISRFVLSISKKEYITYRVTIMQAALDDDLKEGEIGGHDYEYWTRDFCAYPTSKIKPLTTETVIVELPETCDISEESLRIKQVYGYKQ